MPTTSINKDTVNRQWLLKERPRGELDLNIFEYKESPLPEIKDKQVLVALEWFSFDPAQRTWMEPIPTYIPPSELGEPMRAVALGTVVASKNPDFPEGKKVQGMFGWADYVVADPEQLSAPRLVDSAMEERMVLHVLGGTGMTAWAGINCVGKVKAGETVLVSAAAGATGSIAAQLAKQIGATVIGTAGSKEKCDWLVNDCGLDAAINYREQNLDKELAKLCPKGINVFYDNVGGDTLDTTFKYMAQYGRIVLCGQIAHYQSAAPPMRYFMNTIVRSLTIQGFIVFDYYDQAPKALTELSSLIKAGKLQARYDIQEGFKNIPDTILRLFSGKNTGKQLLKND